MEQEAFIEVTAQVWNRNRLTKWIKPVRVRKIPMLFDVWCWMIVSRESNLDFNDVQNMDPEEFFTWAVYGGYCSYLSTRNKRPRITVLEMQEWVKGILMDDRKRIMDKITNTRSVGEHIQEYQEARSAMSGDGNEKKKESSDLKS